MNKQFIFVILLLIFHHVQTYAQFSFHNFGNIKMHENAQIGFYENVINDGSFDENLGLAGFYNSNTAFVAGALSPVFHDMEVLVPNDLLLNVGVGITNNGNFILGEILTPRNLPDVNLRFIGDAFYTGDADFTNVDGYSSINDKKSFIFPIGDNQNLRPLNLESNEVNNAAKAAYFREDPNNPHTFSNSFITDSRTDFILSVSKQEYWDLDGEIPSKITLTWNAESELVDFIDEIQNLRIVGWNTLNNEWQDLGNTNLIGDFDSGEITSDIFTPDEFSVITFGGGLSKKTITMGNYLLTPNGDGINDFFVIEAITLSPNNQLRIFNRWGRAVYEEENYTNLFNGKANVKSVFDKEEKLPSGVYFYIINLYDIDFIHQGYMHIEQD